MLRRVVIATLMLVACVASGARASAYTIDGNISDWGVTLKTTSWHSWQQGLWGTVFVQSSFTPNPLGTIDYIVQDYPISDSKPTGGEYYDYEAAYFDDSATTLYVGIISSHPWDASQDVFTVTANGITIKATNFDQFATANLGVDEVLNGKHYPNYFWEGAISVSRFGQLADGTTVTVYANCSISNPPPDSITLCGTINNAPPTGQCVPEPTTIALLGLGLTALVGRGWRRRRAA